MGSKIYTKTGDTGTTGLFGGGRVGKDSARIEAYGMVDELNSVLGWCAVVSEPEWLRTMLRGIQQKLFVLGAGLATPLETRSNYSVPRIQEADATVLEHAIDEQDTHLSSLKRFILPGGTELAARFHIARTVCRRAERALVHLSGREEIGAHDIVFLNRLSDLLFMLARRANQLSETPDVEWDGKSSGPIE